MRWVMASVAGPADASYTRGRCALGWLMTLAVVGTLGCGETASRAPDAGSEPEVDAGAVIPRDAGDPCADGERSGDETDVDCGRSCAPCGIGGRCDETADCVEAAICLDSECRDPACDDGVRDGDESDVDCGGSCGACAEGASCGSGEDCADGVCEASVCAAPSCADGVRNGDETGRDCGGSCEGCADDEGCLVDGDCVGQVCYCPTLRTADGECTAAEGSLCRSTCEDGVRNQDESDVDCGGGCAACADGASCGVTGDCAGVCEDSVCVSCEDGVRNQDETDVDCGGESCAACEDLAACASPEDCASGVCEDSVCVSCEDGERNQGETDVDCGGPACGGCTFGLGCEGPDDCASALCVDGQCTSCPDGVRNGDETGVDCGGSLCAACPDFEGCVEAADCASGVCTDGLCGTCAPFGTDDYGYVGCVDTMPVEALPCPDLMASDAAFPLVINDDLSMTLELGTFFSFEFRGVVHESFNFAQNGAVRFGVAHLTRLGDPFSCSLRDAPPTVAAFWDDLSTQRADRGIWLELPTEEGEIAETLSIQWTASSSFPVWVSGGSEDPGTVRAVLHREGVIELCYVDTDFGDGNEANAGASAVIGLDGPEGELPYSCEEPAAPSGTYIRFIPPSG